VVDTRKVPESGFGEVMPTKNEIDEKLSN
jgi:hypothetical protein